MKRRYALTGLGLVAAIALVSTAIAGGVPGAGSSGKNAAASAKKKKVKAKPGPPGPQGPQGIQGPPGANGTNGTNGTNGSNGATNVVTRTTGLTVNATLTNEATATCNAGERATGGGYAQATTVPNNQLFFGASRPSPTSGTPTGWFVQLSNTSGTTQFVGLVYVICASP